MLNSRDPVVSGALTLRVYERRETQFFLSSCAPGMTFLDVGANIGYYTALAIPLIGVSGQVVALEPDPECYALLLATVAANSGAKVTCIPKAAGASRGTMRLYQNQNNRADNRLYPHGMATTHADVEVIDIDSMLEEQGIKQVDLVKIDVQGFEGQVLRGMSKALVDCERMIMMIEFWPLGLRSCGTDPASMLNSIKRLGFNVFELDWRGKIRPMNNMEKIEKRFTGQRYTNIVAIKGA